MDVRCNRCATEYDFDDALISERGTTVRCTNCGLEFRVFPSRTEQQAPDRWAVRTTAGRDHLYTSLRELQRGIANREVSPQDWLSRPGQAPRTLGSIAELAPFFASSKAPPPPAEPAQRNTLHGVAPSVAHTAPTPAIPSVVPRPASLRAASTQTAAVARAREAEAIPNGARATAPKLPYEPLPLEDEPPTLTPGPSALPPVRTASDPEVERAFMAGATSAEAGTNSFGGMQPTPPPRAPLGSGSFASPEPRSSPTASSPFNNGPVSSRRALRSYEEIADEATHGRRARSRWIAAVVIAGVTSLFAVTVGRRYLLETAGLGASSESTTNARVAELLREGNRWIEAGDLEAASEPLLRASALAEKDRAVVAALAKLETLRADLIWLKLRLLDPNVTELVQATHKELGRRVGKARAAADAAFAVAPEDLVVQRARVDVLRLSGDQPQAREWIKPMLNNPNEPHNAYVLAALDMAEPKPDWQAVIARLHTAANGEKSPGRAHAALIYALARGGQLEQAQTELGKLDTNASGAALVDELQGFLKRFGTKQEGAQPAPAPTVDTEKLGKLDTAQPEERPAVKETRPSSGNAEAATSNDFRRLLAEAAQAVGRGELKRAEETYERALALSPGNTEALAGLGDVARRRNDTAAATRYYDRVLADNPSYLPALMAKADQQWASGNRSAALALYHKVVDQTGGSTEYGRRAAQRIAEAGANKEEKPEADAPAAPAEAQAPKPSDIPPEIDTTDLPGLK